VVHNYDFGDDWHFITKHEEIVDDYYFGYPTLLDGAETAPPEGFGRNWSLIFELCVLNACISAVMWYN